MEGYHCSEEHTAPSAVCMLLEICSFETLETYLIAECLVTHTGRLQSKHLTLW